MWLNKFVASIDKADAVDVKIRNLLEEVLRMPETKEDLVKLMRLASAGPVIEAAPDINVEAVNMQLVQCKQILVATNDYYYI
jgi:hypothetical protein